MAVPEAIGKVWKSLVETNSFDRVLNKIKLISVGQGKCQAEMVVEQEHTNSTGTLHGGLTATIVDVISGVALISHDKYPAGGVSIDIHVMYMNAAPLGEKIIIDARTNRVGRTLAFLEVDIKNKSTNKLIIKGTHTKYIGKS